MTKYTDRRWSDLVREHGPTIAHADRPQPGRAPLLRRPRVLAGGTLALAGGGTALALALTAVGSTPAFAITKNADGSVLVEINQTTSLPQANTKLTVMGIDEQVNIEMATGPAPAKGPVSCTPEPGAPGPPLKVLIGQDGTEVIAGGNTGAGTWHLAACKAFKTGDSGPGSGNSGTVFVPPGSAAG